jgi:uncharacterized protein
VLGHKGADQDDLFFCQVKSGVGSSMWYELAKAFCLLLVLEGIMPFVAPGRWRQVAEQLARIDDRSMRIIGAVSMLVGAVLLFLVKKFWG